MNKNIQTRELKATGVTLREAEGKRTIEGLIPYNSRSEDMGFYEYIAPTAFNKTLADGADVRALMNHDSNKLLGRVKNGSLRLRSEEDGLHIECDLPETSYAEDAYKLIRDGYNNGLSFGFITIKDVWEEKEEDGETRTVCTLIEVRLLEVSFCVSFPAYEATDSNARNVRSILDDLKAIRLEDLSAEDAQALDTTLRGLLEQKHDATDSTEAAESTSAAAQFDKQLDEFIASLG